MGKDSQERMYNMDVFLRKISEIRAALKAELYNCALAVSLTLPDICGKVEFPSEKTSSTRYKEWFVKYVEPLTTSPATVLPGEETVDYTWITSDECWALRCAVLHAGNYEVERIKLRGGRIHVHKRNGQNYSHMVRDSRDADWDGIQLCETLCTAAEQYYLTIKRR